MTACLLDSHALFKTLAPTLIICMPVGKLFNLFVPQFFYLKSDKLCSCIPHGVSMLIMCQNASSFRFQRSGSDCLKSDFLTGI